MKYLAAAVILLASTLGAFADDFGPQPPSPMWGGAQYSSPPNDFGNHAPAPTWGENRYQNQNDVTGPQAPSPMWGQNRY